MQSDNVQLTFAIACGGRTDLRDRLKLSLATARFPFTTEVLYGARVDQAVGQLRNQLYQQARGRYVYFLDEDCEWPSTFPIDQLEIWMKSGEAFSGPYHNGRLCTFFGRAYNFMTHTWLRVHAHLNAPVPVAGNALIPKTASLLEPYPGAAIFGGEEQALIDSLKRSGIQLHYREDLAVEHNARHSLPLFFSRAWLHGRAPAPGKMRLSLKAYQALPSLNPLMMLALAAFYLTQISARKWRRQ